MNENPLVDPAWSKHDVTAKRIVVAYNGRFGTSAGFKALDWRWVKAMLWQESGAKSNAWDSRPLQIGNPGDPGLTVVKGESSSAECEKVNAVVPQDLQMRLKKEKMTPELNIEAGVAYLFYMATFRSLKRGTVDDNKNIVTYKLEKNELPSTVAGKLGTTTAVILADSGLTQETVKRMKPEATIRYHKAHEAWQIGGWSDWMTAIHAYNGGGVARYEIEVKRRYDKIVQVFAE